MLATISQIKVAIIRAVYEANPARQLGNIGRRIIKLGEEYGEASEAYLNVTSASNGKGKTWDDVREELADTLIVALDVALTPNTQYGETGKELLAALTSDARRNPNYSMTSDQRLETLMLQVQYQIGAISQTYVLDRWLRANGMVLVATAFDAALAQMPDQENHSRVQIAEGLSAEVTRKLAKWTRNRDTGKVATDAE